MVKIVIYLNVQSKMKQIELFLNIIPKIFKTLREKTSKYVGRTGGGIVENDKTIATYNVQTKAVKVEKTDGVYCETCAEADEYLKGNRLNSIASGSILHKQFAKNSKDK